MARVLSGNSIPLAVVPLGHLPPPTPCGIVLSLALLFYENSRWTSGIVALLQSGSASRQRRKTGTEFSGLTEHIRKPADAMKCFDKTGRRCFMKTACLRLIRHLTGIQWPHFRPKPLLPNSLRQFERMDSRTLPTSPDRSVLPYLILNQPGHHQRRDASRMIFQPTAISRPEPQPVSPERSCAPRSDQPSLRP